MDATVLPMYVDVSHPRYPGSFRMPLGSDDNVLSAMQYGANAGDLFICSYPKCGCTWLQNIIWRMLHDGEGTNGHIRDKIPMLEFDGKESVMDIKQSGGLKIIKTHFPYYDWIPKHPQAKYIFIAREPKDVCVSMYYHVKGFEGYKYPDGRFDDFLDLFLDGKADCCDYFEMLDEWLRLESDDSVHIMFYEQLIMNQQEQIRNLAKFIGADVEIKLMANNATLLESIIENTSFRKMREQDKQWYRTKRSTPFIRKGIIGDWKNHMTADQAARFDSRTVKLIKKYPKLKLWNISST